MCREVLDINQNSILKHVKHHIFQDVRLENKSVDVEIKKISEGHYFRFVGEFLPMKKCESDRTEAGRIKAEVARLHSYVYYGLEVGRGILLN
jgi:hypothetical protein